MPGINVMSGELPVTGRLLKGVLLAHEEVISAK